MKTNASNWNERDTELLRAFFSNHGSEWEGWQYLLPSKSRTQIASKARGTRLQKVKDMAYVSYGKRQLVARAVEEAAEMLGMDSIDVAYMMLDLSISKELSNGMD